MDTNSVHLLSCYRSFQIFYFLWFSLGRLYASRSFPCSSTLSGWHVIIVISYDTLYFCGISLMLLLSFLIFFESSLFFLNLAKDLSLFKKQALFHWFFLLFFNGLSFICTLIFVISFLLLSLGLICSFFFYSFLRCKFRLLFMIFFFLIWIWIWKLLSRVWLLETPWAIQSMEFSRQNTGVGSLSPLQGILTTQGSNPGLLHSREILYQLSHQGIPSFS